MVAIFELLNCTVVFNKNCDVYTTDINNGTINLNQFLCKLNIFAAKG